MWCDKNMDCLLDNKIKYHLLNINIETSSKTFINKRIRANIKLKRRFSYYNNYFNFFSLFGNLNKMEKVFIA